MATRTMRPGELEAELQSRLAATRAPRPRKAIAHPRGRIRPRAASLLAAVAMLAMAAGAFASHGSSYINLTEDNTIVEHNDAIYAQGGVGAGTGNFDPFLTLSTNDPTESGYNSPDDAYDQFFGGGRTHELLVSAVPTLEYNGSLYREFSLDANDQGSDTWMSVDEIKIFVDTQLGLTGYNNTTETFSNDAIVLAEKIFDMDEGDGGDQTILMVSQGLESGSGVSDITVLVPNELFPEECAYGSTDCDLYLYFWTAMGFEEPGDVDGTNCTQNPCDWDVSAGFEEWRIRFLPVVNIEKDATASFTRDYDWTVDKTVTPDTLDLFDGDTADVTWEVTPTRDDGTDSDFLVTGTITITNPTGAPPIPTGIDAEIISLEDVLSLDGSDIDVTDIDCELDGDPVTFPTTLEPGDSIECTYSVATPNATSESDGENVATVTIESGIPEGDGGIEFGDTVSYMGSADVDFSTATMTEVDATATLTDDRGPLDQAAVSGQTEDYEEEFACPDDEGTEENTARVTEDDSGDFDEDSASVTITCYDLSIVKTAVESRTRTWNWTIEKSVTPDTWDLFDGDSGTSEYTVTVTKTGFTDSDFHVEGTITITNNHPDVDADLTEVTDSISGFGDVSVDCPSLTVPKNGGTLVCTYETDLPNGDSRTNTATATQQNYDYDADGIASDGDTTDYTDTEAINFAEAVTVEVNDEINVDDTYAGDLGSFDDTGSTSYSRTFDCDADEGEHDNTATIVETGQSDDATVTVTCYELSVTKDADEDFTRTYEWNIEKSADQTALTLMPGQQFLVNYQVTVSVVGSEDSDWHVEGDITISNPHPTLDADLTGVSDEVFDGIAATVVCPSLTVPAGGSLVCTYETDLPDATERTNTATATQQNYDYDKDLNATASGTTDYSGTAQVVFGDPTELVDECVDVSDTIAGPLGEVCVGDAPQTFNYSTYVGPYTVEQCGDQDFPNTADLITNDTGTTDEAMYNIDVTIPCPEGCTLTQGYWKTHNESFHGGAPADPNWFLIGDVDGDGVSEGEEEDFFDLMIDGEPATWFDVFWTSPAGRPYYQLAHQWMAAYLNKLSIEDIGGSIPADIQLALDQGAALLDEYDGSEAGKSPDIKGKDAKAIRALFTGLAGDLAEFNEGDAGIPHCDEDLTSNLTLGATGAPVFLAPIGLLAPITAWMRRRVRR